MARNWQDRRLKILTLAAQAVLGEPCEVYYENSRDSGGALKSLGKSYAKPWGKEITLCAVGFAKATMDEVFSHELGHHALGHLTPVTADTPQNAITTGEGSIRYLAGDRAPGLKAIHNRHVSIERAADVYAAIMLPLITKVIAIAEVEYDREFSA